MAGNEVAALVTDAMPYITAAVGAYGGAVLAETRDKVADATVGAGVRILQRLFGHEKPGTSPLPEPLADVVAHPGDGKFLVALTAAVSEALEQDAAMLADVRALVPGSQGTVVTQNVSAARDAYASVGTMIVHQRPE